MADDGDRDRPMALSMNDFLCSKPTPDPGKGRGRSRSWLERLREAMITGRGANDAQSPHVTPHVTVPITLDDVSSLTLRERLLRRRGEGDDGAGNGPPLMKRPLAAFFVRCGAESLEKCEPAVLEQHCLIDDDDDNEDGGSSAPPGLLHFAFPGGQLEVVGRGPSYESCKPALLFPIAERPEDTFLITLTAFDANLGERVTMWCLVSVQVLPLSGEGVWATAPTAFMLVSHHPFLALHAQVLHHVVEQYRIRALLCKKPAKESAADDLLALLHLYARRDLPQPGADFVFQCGDGGGLVAKFRLPCVNARAELLARWALPALVHGFSQQPELFLEVLSAILLERKVAVVDMSGNLRLCSLVPLGLLSCISPFSYEGTVVSVLPPKLAELLSAPVPLLVGTTTMTTTAAAATTTTAPASGSGSARRRWFRSSASPAPDVCAHFPPDVSLLLLWKPAAPTRQQPLDRDYLEPCFRAQWKRGAADSPGAAPPEAVPKLPSHGELLKALAPHFSAMQALVAQQRRTRADISFAPYDMTGDMLPIVQAVTVTLSDAFERWFANFRAFSARDTTIQDQPVTAFVKEAFLAHQPPADRAFFAQFLGTQSFGQFEAQRLRFIDGLE